MSKKVASPQPSRFCWNELVTPSVPAAKQFYAGLFGWKTRPFGKDAVGYTLFKTGKDPRAAGGVMKCPKPGKTAQWIPYVFVGNVDSTLKKAIKLGGKIAAPPFVVPTVGRIAVLVDPQGATIGVLKPEM
jgi:predicted enzyme related to lactoylglutathione lyase